MQIIQSDPALFVLVYERKKERKRKVLTANKYFAIISMNTCTYVKTCNNLFQERILI